ncbi:MAG: putative chromosome-partitioning protein ParB [Myxococcota bacterium]|nr:putative chromosome-partitioning protein ParB [Myxococcota bacterium]
MTGLNKKSALGKGLSVLLGDEPAAPSRPGLATLGVEEIKPNRRQPRKQFPGAELQELAESIREHGVLQPLIVRRTADGHQIVAGERRWRAAQLAGLREVPVVIREASDQATLELALVENIQRQDLNPVEEAMAYQDLLDFGLTQQEVAQRVGRSREAVANSLRLLRLPQPVVEMIAQGKLSEGHGRALAGASSLGEAEVIRLAQTAAALGLSVRQTEALVRQAAKPQAAAESSAVSAEERWALEQITSALKSRVEVRHRNGKGRVIIHFQNHGELERLINIFKSGSLRK